MKPIASVSNRKNLANFNKTESIVKFRELSSDLQFLEKMGLTKEAFAKYWNENPHSRQAFINWDSLDPNDEIIKNRPILEVDRVLNDSSPYAAYARRMAERKTVEHHGQRKLFLSELDFITRMGIAVDHGLANIPEETTVDYIIIYAGGAPGIHLSTLMELMPSIAWRLYDPRAFSIKDSEGRSVTGMSGTTKQKNAKFFDPSVKLITYSGNDGFFTVDVATEIAQMRQSAPSNIKLYFISDIRSVPSGLMRGEIDYEIFETELPKEEAQQIAAFKDENERHVSENMVLQRDTTLIMNPDGALLKFRLPYSKESIFIKNLDGEVVLQCWTGPTSSEGRLLVRPDKHSHQVTTKYWDSSYYEDLLFYHNKFARPAIYRNRLSRDENYTYDGCFDCTNEIEIIDRFLASRHVHDDEEAKRYFDYIYSKLEEISPLIGGGVE